jgi:hypothetical protein
MVEVMGSGKHSSLLRYGNNYCRKKFYSTGPWRYNLSQNLRKITQNFIYELGHWLYWNLSSLVVT